MRIESYAKDNQVSVNDKLIGTDGDKFNKTKNFPITGLANFVLAQLQNSGVVFRFSDGSNLPVGTSGYFFSEGAVTNKTNITNLYFSKTSYFGEVLTELFTSVGSNLGDLYLGLTQQDDTANYGYFNVANVTDEGDYFTIEADLRGNLFAKELVHDKNYALYFDLASSNEFSISIEAGVFMLRKNGALVDQVDMSVYLDDTNLARITGGTVDANGLATFTRDDASTFIMDFSPFLNQVIPQNTSDLNNDGDGTSEFVTRSNTYNKTEVDNKDAVIQNQVTLLNGLTLVKDEVNNLVYLKNAAGTTLSQFEGYENDGAGYTIEFDVDSRTIYIMDADNNIVDSVPVSIMINDKMDKGGYTGTGQDLKDYIDTLLRGLKWKDSVLCATTANIILSGEQTIDGVFTNASRVLVKDQTNTTENGIYISGAGAWTRALDADSEEELVEATVGVEQGETNANVKFTCVTAEIVLGTTDIEWGFLTEVLGVTQLELNNAIAELANKRLSNLVIDLSAAEQTAIKNKLGITDGGITFTTDESLYLDPDTSELRANVSNYSHKFIYVDNMTEVLPFEPTALEGKDLGVYTNKGLKIDPSLYTFTPPVTMTFQGLESGDILYINFEHFLEI